MEIQKTAIDKGFYAVKIWQTESVGQGERVVAPSSIRVQYYKPSTYEEILHNDYFERAKFHSEVLHDPTIEDIKHEVVEDKPKRTRRSKASEETTTKDSE